MTLLAFNAHTDAEDGLPPCVGLADDFVHVVLDGRAIGELHSVLDGALEFREKCLQIVENRWVEQEGDLQRAGLGGFVFHIVWGKRTAAWLIRLLASWIRNSPENGTPGKVCVEVAMDSV